MINEPRDPDIELEAMFWLRDHPVKHTKKRAVTSPWMPRKKTWTAKANRCLNKMLCGAVANWLLAWLLSQGHITDTVASVGMVSVMTAMAFILGKDFPWKEVNW